MNTDRHFDLNGQTYYINQPTASDIRDSDWNYSKTYSKSLVEGIYTSSEMNDILKKRGIIGPEYDKRAQELSDILESTLTNMYTLSTDGERKKAAEEAEKIRNDIFQWNHRLNGPMSNTCEQIADDAKLEFLTSRIVVSDKGELIWKDYDAFLNDSDPLLPARAKFEVMLYLQGLDSDFLDQVPEAVVLKDIENKKNIDESEIKDEKADVKNDVNESVIKDEKNDIRSNDDAPEVKNEKDKKVKNEVKEKIKKTTKDKKRK